MATGTINISHPTPGLEYKAATAVEEAGLIGADDETGVVEAIVSVTGVRDHDNDIIEPGAYRSTLAKRRPKGIFSHDWGRWASRTEVIEELMPGDSRLGEYAAKMDKPWPAEAGGLYVRTRYNLATQNGRDAYHDVKFFSETGECEWSVGYKVPTGKGLRGKDGVRRIKEMDLYEYSPVLFGSASLSGTLSVKATPTAEPEVEIVEEADDDEIDWAELENEADGLTDDEIAEAELDGDEGEDEGGDSEPGEDEDATLADTPAPEPAADPAPNIDPDADNGDGEVEAEPADGGEKSAPSVGGKPAPPKSGSGSRATTPGGDKDTWKITNVEQLRAAVRGFGAVKDSEKEKVRAHIMKRAFALNRPDLIPKDWKKTGKTVEDAPEAKRMGTGLDRSPRKNWVEMTGRLPPYIEEVAKSIHEKRGVPLDSAIPIAIATIKKRAAGGNAKAIKALAEWEALKARNAARRGKADSIDDVEHELAGDAELPQIKSLPFLPGTYEELKDLLHAEATAALTVDEPYLVEVLGTWPDRAVVTRYALDGESKADSFEIPYSLDEGTVTLGDPVPVTITVDTGGTQSSGADLLPHTALVENVTAMIKSMLAADETKAGRVLSGTNANRLKAAVEQLIAVLIAAGIELKTPDQEEPEDQIPIEEDSTAPSVRGDRVPVGKTLVDPAVHARAYRILGDVHAR